MRSPLLISLLAMMLLANGCRSQELPDLAAADIVRQAAARMTQMSGFHFIIDRTGAPAYLDPAETLSFRRAEGDFVAPDRSRATVRIIGPGLVTDVNVISVAEIQWETNLLTGRWEELPPDWGFNPTVLFDPDVGLRAILMTDLSNLGETKAERLEDGPDQLLYAVSADVAGERLYQMSGGLIGPDPATMVMWVAPETFELHRILLTETEAGSEEPSLWQVDFAAFNQVVEINPPHL
jgi:lipoprotein LprG